MQTLLRLATEFAECINQNDGLLLPATARSTCRLATGRSALFHLISRLPAAYAKTVLLPSYIAEGVIKPFLAAGFDLRFYRLAADLQPNESDVAEILGNIPAPPLFILIHYFGYPAGTPELLAMLRKADALVVSDCAHAPLSQTEDGIPLGEIGDIALYSLNKFIPVCDGAILSSMTPNVDVSLNEEVLPTLPMATLEAYNDHLKACRDLFDAQSPAQAIEYLYEIDATYDAYYQFINNDFTPRRQSEASQRIEARFPFIEAANQRRRNGARVYQALAHHRLLRPIFREMPGSVVPFAVAVKVAGQRREQVQEWLFDQNIMSSSLKDKWDFVPREDEGRFCVELDFLRNHLLLPVSESMSEDDTSQLIEALHRIN